MPLADVAGVGGAAKGIFIPRGKEHAFLVTGPRPAEFVTAVTPGGFESFFARAAEDKSFRAALTSNPHAALKQMLGVDPIPAYTIKVVEEQPGEIVLTKSDGGGMTPGPRLVEPSRSATFSDARLSGSMQWITSGQSSTSKA